MERCCIIRVEKSPLSLNRKEQKGFLSSLNWGVIWGEEEDLEITLGADSRKLKSENKAKLFLSFPPLRKECSLGNFCPSRRGRATAGDRYLGPQISIWITSNSACLEPALWGWGRRVGDTSVPSVHMPNFQSISICPRMSGTAIWRPGHCTEISSPGILLLRMKGCAN